MEFEQQKASLLKKIEAANKRLEHALKLVDLTLEQQLEGGRKFVEIDKQWSGLWDGKKNNPGTSTETMPQGASAAHPHATTAVHPRVTGQAAHSRYSQYTRTAHFPTSQRAARPAARPAAQP